MLKSNFKSDLKKEQKKSKKKYSKWELYNLEILTHNSSKKEFLVDEKAQLDYINKDLPTFAFELSYFKKNIQKKGWLFDTSKETMFYALITSIYSNNSNSYTSCKITFVNRKKLLSFLNNTGLNEDYLNTFCLDNKNKHGKIKLPRLHHKTEGYLFISSENKAEKPINLILRLDFLIKKGIAKQFV